MRRTPARRVEPGSALWRGFLASGSSGHDFMRSLSSPRRKVQLPYIIQCIKTAGKLATTSDCCLTYQFIPVYYRQSLDTVLLTFTIAMVTIRPHSRIGSADPGATESQCFARNAERVTQARQLHRDRHCRFFYRRTLP